MDSGKRFCLILLFGITVMMAGCTKVEKYSLEVHVVHLLDNSTVTGATVQILLADAENRVLARQPLNEYGVATFLLPPGSYLVKMVSGYTGQKDVDIQESTVITLKVIEVLR